MLFWQFSKIIINVKIVGKIPDKHLSLWLFSNPDSCWKYETDLSRSSPSFLDIVPWIWKYPYIPMLILYLSNNLDIHDYVGKMPKQHFGVWLFSNPGDKILFLLKFNEARISEWNIHKHFLYHIEDTRLSAPIFFFFVYISKLQKPLGPWTELNYAFCSMHIVHKNFISWFFIK